LDDAFETGMIVARVNVLAVNGLGVGLNLLGGFWVRRNETKNEP
jgi:hypothetical protein